MTKDMYLALAIYEIIPYPAQVCFEVDFDVVHLSKKGNELSMNSYMLYDALLRLCY